MSRWFGLMEGAVCGAVISMGAAVAGEDLAFSTASLSGSYVYSNSADGVASFGIINFDGKGGVTLDIRINARQAEGQRATIEARGSGVFSVNSQGIGSAEIAMTKGPMPRLDYDFLIVAAENGVAEEVLAVLRSGGVNGQLVQPSWKRRANAPVE